MTPEHVGKPLVELVERRAASDDDCTNSLTALRAKLTEAETRLGRLYAAIENGVADPADATLKDRVAVVKNERHTAQVAFDRTVAEMHQAAPKTGSRRL